MLVCIAPLLSVVLSILFATKGNENSISLFFNVKTSFYTNVWTTFGIAAALFTGILAFIDYFIRKELTITLFGFALFISAILDVYYLLILNENNMPLNRGHDFSQNFYFIWLVNRLFYSLTLLLGTIFYLRIKAKNLRTNEQKTKIILRTAIVSVLSCIACIGGGGGDLTLPTIEP
ncbi:hypothetical protein [Pedobacter sp. ASV28]|uniref:hypothetical protein n=1 Tax=Pedobacter sp. ASV28 TaxID=2795123 RepID=UPI0018EB020E|nr:hypothetical protein [Pedobacter sp. ASV28]